MSALVVGSIGLDSIETPRGRVTDVLGGSAVYFAWAASAFGPVRLVGAVGEDFTPEALEPLGARGVDLRGVSADPGRTFRWAGRYGANPNQRETLTTELGVFEHFRPELPLEYRDSRFIFLANIDPSLQLSVLEQIGEPELVALDTMDFWIASKPDELRRALARAQVVVINDAELRQLADEVHLIGAARRVLEMGPEAVVTKKGEHGAMLVTRDSCFLAPAYPTESVMDPTGAGDTFAGGFMGYLARAARIDEAAMRTAVLMGTVLASFCVESFGIDRLARLTPDQPRARLAELGAMIHVDLDGSLFEGTP